jgi:hypothetical protein
MYLKFLLQFLQQAASGFGTKPTVAVVDGSTSLPNGGSGNGCWKLLKSEVDCQQLCSRIPCGRIYEMVMMI